MESVSSLPPYWKGSNADVDETVAKFQASDSDVIAVSPGGRKVWRITPGPRAERHGQANYNSACGAGNPEFFRGRQASDAPVVLLIGGIHGHEVEGIVGLINLLQVASTGCDHRGQPWPELQTLFHRCRVIVVPIANPDGRSRCLRDDFMGVSVNEMSRIGQGTRRDGTLYGWPGCKAVHPMQGDVGFLGAYFNDDGINLMHDEFFSPMAAETRALLHLATYEAPDIILNLHSHGGNPEILSTAYVPHTCKVRAFEFAERLGKRYQIAGIPVGRSPSPREDGLNYPPPAFNLTSALHHSCGGLSMLFESPHGLAEPQYAQVTHDQILDLHLILFETLLTYALE